MRKMLANGAALAASLLPGIAAPTAARLAPRVASLCTPPETALFSCAAGVRVLSVCAQGDRVQYRFGTARLVELAYPARPGPNTMYHAEATYSGGGEAQIGFTQGGIRYVVYSSMVRTRFDGRGNEPAFSAGVLSLRDGHRIADRRCTAPSDAMLDETAAQRLLPVGEITRHD